MESSKKKRRRGTKNSRISHQFFIQYFRHMGRSGGGVFESERRSGNASELC